MNQITKITPKLSKLQIVLSHVLDFIFSNAIGVTGLAILVGFVLTDRMIYLKIACILSLMVTSLFLLLNATALIKFGINEVIAEIEVKFLDLTLYSTFLMGTFFFLTLEIFF